MCIHIYIYIHIHICTYIVVFIYLCVEREMCKHMHMHTYIHTYVYIHIYRAQPRQPPCGACLRSAGRRWTRRRSCRWPLATRSTCETIIVTILTINMFTINVMFSCSSAYWQLLLVTIIATLESRALKASAVCSCGRYVARSPVYGA